MDWKKLVGTVAPWIGAALGGPMGSAAVEVVASALGLSEKTEDSIKQALSGVTPEQMLALKNADQQFAVQMKQLGYTHIEAVAALAVDNTKDARNMQVKTRSKIPGALAIFTTIGFFGILIGMMTGSLESKDNQALLIMLGSLGAAWGGIMNYYFGSSSSSQDKTELLAKADAIK